MSSSFSPFSTTPRVSLPARSALTATFVPDHRHTNSSTMVSTTATKNKTKKNTESPFSIISSSGSLLSVGPLPPILSNSSSSSSSPSVLASFGNHSQTKTIMPSIASKPATASAGPSTNTKPITARTKRNLGKFNPSDYPIKYPVHPFSPKTTESIPADQRAMIPQAQDIATKRYATSVDPRNFLTVYEYSTINGQPIIWDYNTGYVHITGLWKATGHTKADIVKLIDNSPPEIEQVIRRVRGGFLKIQGTWLPFDIAKRLAQRTCWFIRYALVPVFGPEFPEECLTPEMPGFGQLLLISSNTKLSRRTAAPTEPANTSVERTRKRSTASGEGSSRPANEVKRPKTLSSASMGLSCDYPNRSSKGAASPVTPSQNKQLALASKKPKKKSLNPPPLMSPLTAHALLAPAPTIVKQSSHVPPAATITVSGFVSNNTPPTPPHDDSYQNKTFYSYAPCGNTDIIKTCSPPAGEASTAEDSFYDSDEEVLNATRCLQMLSRHAHHDYYYGTDNRQDSSFFSDSHFSVTKPANQMFVPVVDNGFGIIKQTKESNKISVSSLLS